MSEQWKHQEIARVNAKLLSWYGLFFKPGAGKSKAVIDILRDKFNSHGQILRTIIITVPNVVPQFRDEWLKFSKIDPKKVILLQGSGVKRLETFQKNTLDNQGKVFIANWESLLMAPLFEAFVKWKPEALVWDESQKAKSIKAKRAKLADVLSNPYDKVKRQKLPKPYTYVLSGSAILKNPMDLFMQIKILDGGTTFGTNFFVFRARYFRDENAAMPKDRYFPKWVPKNVEFDGFDSLKEIQEKLSRISMYADIEKYLPPLIKIPVHCEMTREQARLYKELKKDFLTFFNNAPCTADLAIVKQMRMMQVVSGFISTERPGIDEEPVVTELKDTHKYEQLKEKLTQIIESGEKVLIWAVFKKNYATIRRACDEVAKETGIDFEYVEMHGEAGSEKTKLESIQRFQSDSRVRVYIGHPGSGGVGVNLVQARYSLFYSRTHNLEHYLQAIKRNHRGGSKEQGHENITVYDLVCTDTIDELILEDLGRKEKLADQILISGKGSIYTDDEIKQFVNRLERQKY